MELSTQQLQAIKEGEPVRARAAEIETDCIVLRADVFEQVRHLFIDDWSEDEMRLVAARAMESADLGERSHDAAWAAEIQRRISEIDAGSVRLVPWEEARQIIRGEVGDEGKS